MNTRKYTKSKSGIDRKHLLENYNLLVGSLREVRNMQTLLEKERQMRRLLYIMRSTRQMSGS